MILNKKAAGRKIGILERVLTLLLVIQNQYLAIGFLIAAKSLLRFKDTERAKTEYVLIGTLLSFGTAIVIGILLTDNAQGAKLLLLHIFDFFKRIQT